MQSPVKVWRKDPRFLTDYYKPGMDLGEPDDEYQPEPLVKPESKNPKIPKKGGPARKEVITKKQYERLRAQGLSRAAIAAAYGIGYSTLGAWIKEWGLK